MSGRHRYLDGQEGEQWPALECTFSDNNGAPNNYPVPNPFGNVGQSATMVQQLQRPSQLSHQTSHVTYPQVQQLGQSQLQHTFPFYSGLTPLFHSHQYLPPEVPNQHSQHRQYAVSMQPVSGAPLLGRARPRSVPGSQSGRARQPRLGFDNADYLQVPRGDLSFSQLDTSFNSAGSVNDYATSLDFPASSTLSLGLETNPSQELSSCPTSISSFPVPPKPRNDTPRYTDGPVKQPDQATSRVTRSLDNASEYGYLPSAPPMVHKSWFSSRMSQPDYVGSNTGSQAGLRASDVPAFYPALNTDLVTHNTEDAGDTSPTRRKKRKLKEKEKAVVHQHSLPTHAIYIPDVPASKSVWSAPVGTNEKLHDYMESREDPKGICLWPTGQQLQALSDLMDIPVLEIELFAFVHEGSGSQRSCHCLDAVLPYTTDSNPKYALRICRQEDVKNVKTFIETCKKEQRQNKNKEPNGGHLCPEEDCGQQFKNFGTWLRHMQILFPVDFYLCLLCLDGSIVNRNIGEHMRGTHGLEKEVKWKPHARRILYDPPMDFICPCPGCAERFEGYHRAAGYQRMLRHYWDDHVIGKQIGKRGSHTSRPRHSSAGPRDRQGQGGPPGGFDDGNNSGDPGAYHKCANPTQPGHAPINRGNYSGRGTGSRSGGHQHAPSIDAPRGRQRGRATSDVSSSKSHAARIDGTTGVTSSIDDIDLRAIGQQMIRMDGAVPPRKPFWSQRASSRGDRTRAPDDDDSSDTSVYDRSMEASVASLSTNMTEHSLGPNKGRSSDIEGLQLLESPVRPSSADTPLCTATQVPHFADMAVSWSISTRHERRSTIPLIRTALNKSSKAPWTRLSSSLPRTGAADSSNVQPRLALPFRQRFCLSASYVCRSDPPHGQSRLILSFASGLTLIHYSLKGCAVFWCNASSSMPEWLSELVSEHRRRKTYIYVDDTSYDATIRTSRIGLSALV